MHLVAYIKIRSTTYIIWNNKKLDYPTLLLCLHYL